MVLTDFLSFFPGNFWAKNSRFLVLAIFFKQGLPKLYSTCPVALSAEFFSKNHINWHCERKNSAGFVQTAIYFSGELLNKTIVVYYSLPDSSSMGCQNCIPRVQRHFLRNFFHRIILIGTVSQKIQLVLSELHSTFPRSFRAKQFSFTIPCQILQACMGCQNCIQRVQRHFLRNFFHRIIIIGTVNEKNQMVLTDFLSFFPGNFWAKNSRFLVLARFFKQGLPKLYSTCPVALSAEFFSKNHINWHCERKNSAGFVQTAIYFSGELLSKTIVVYYSLPDSSSMGCQNCIPRVQRHFLRNFFHRIILIGTVSQKIQLVLSELHSTFPRSFRAKQFSFTIPCQILQAWVAKTVFNVSRGTFCGTFFTES